MAFEIPSSIPGSEVANSIIAPFGGGPAGANTPAPGWMQRQGQAAYRSPKGTRIEFQWERVQRVIPLRNTPYEFPEIDDAYVQQNGFSSRQYPLRCIFSGSDCDLRALAFESALLEPGVGHLEHPVYGSFSVVPVGEIVRSDDLVSEANQVVVEVTFWTTTGIVYPTNAKSARNEIAAALAQFQAAQAGQFGGAVNVDGTVARVNLKARIAKFVRSAEATIGAVARARAEINRPFREAVNAINFGLDVLIGQPLQLAQQISNMILAPAKALVGIESRLDAYKALADKIMATPAASGNLLVSGPVAASGRLSGLRLRESNAFQAADLFVAAAVAGSVSAALETQYVTRNQAAAAALAVLAQLDAIVAWRDARYQALEQHDTGETYQALIQAVALVAGYLVAAPSASGAVASSFAVEKRVVLDRARTVIDVCAEYYGKVDEKLDFLIATNDLSGSEILELPAGRELKIYA